MYKKMHKYSLDNFSVYNDYKTMFFVLKFEIKIILKN